MTITHQIQIGDMTCVMLRDTRIRHTMDNISGWFKQSTPALMTEIFGDVAEVPVDINLLYIDTGSTKILADVGFGVVENQPESGKVNQALKNIGVSPEDIDMVFLTHLHVDHIVGLIAPDGNLAYPNARYVMTQAEWDEWIPLWQASESDWDKQQLGYITPIMDNVSFVADGDSIAEGVTVVMIVGHTLGQAGLLVESNGEQLFFVADLMHNECQFDYPEWHLHVDSDGDLAVKSRQSTLQRCVDKNLLTAFCHLTFPGVGHVTKDGNSWKWNPLAT